MSVTEATQKKSLFSLANMMIVTQDKELRSPSSNTIRLLSLDEFICSLCSDNAFLINNTQEITQ